MFSRFETNKSTKGASKLRRDLINTEIANLRDLLPLPQSTRQRLSQLQLMALVCVYVRKANYFQQAFKRFDNGLQNSTPNIGFSKALSGFLMMLTQNGKLLYISDNAAEYLGHSMEDLLIHGDSVYDIIDKQDYNAIQSELSRTGSHNIHQSPSSLLHHHNVNMDGEKRMFLCRMNVSRNARRQMRFGDQKVVLIQGHYLSYLPLCSRNEPVFIATCTPIAMPETRECVVQGATNVFTTIHSMDMKFIHMDRNGEFHMEFTKDELNGSSWYQLVHWDYIKEAQMKHKLITQSEQDRSCIFLTRLQKKTGDFIWIHLVLQVRDSQDSNQQSVIVCTNQVLSDKEASVMLSNSWLYHYYSVQSKIQMGLTTYDASRLPQISNNYYPYQPLTPTAAVSSPLHHPHHHHQHYQIHQMSPMYDLQGHATSVHHYEYSPPITSNLNYQNDINHNSSPTISNATTMKENSLAPVDYSSQATTATINDKISSHHQHHQNGNEKNDEYCEMPAATANVASRKKSSTSSNDDNKSHRHSNHDKKLSKVDYKSVRISNKKYTFKRIESLHISECHPEVVNDVDVVGSRTTSTNAAAAAIYDNHNNEHAVMETEHRDGQMLYVNSSAIHSARSRITKNFTTAVASEVLIAPASTILPPTTSATNANQTTDLDQWNPSPTWSDNNIQKVPDIMHQQLSPYLITTPPTPMSVTTPTYIPHGSTFTFDWAPEHYVPSVASAAAVVGHHEERNIMELTSASARCYYNRPMMMGLHEHHHHHHHNNHKDDTSIRNS